MIDVAKRCLMRFVLVLVFAVVGHIMATMALVFLLPKILQNPRKAFTKKKRNVPPPAYLDPSWGQHHSVQCNGVQLYYVAAGEQDKPLMLFLHGFPESWYSWRHQLRYFRENYRVVAPDLRGYGRSSRPSSSAFDYHPDKLVEDVRCLIEALGYKKCVLVSHDWGGLIGWIFTIRHPDMVERLVAMDIPHPKIFQDYCRKNHSQLSRSKYFLFFYARYIPELIMGLFDWGFLDRVFRHKPNGFINKERLSDDDMEVYKWTISRRGALTAAVNYFRCIPSLVAPLSRPKIGSKRLTMPILLLWGENDVVLDPKMAEEHESSGIFDDITARVLPSCSHWIQQDQPDVVNQLMRAWLTAKQSTSGVQDEEEE